MTSKAPASDPVEEPRTTAPEDYAAGWPAVGVTFKRGLEGRLLLQTVRSHDQFNTTVYSNEDRYRGIHDSRRVVLVHADDLRELGFKDGEHVDVFSEWNDDVERCLRDYRLVAYPTSRHCAAPTFRKPTCWSLWRALPRAATRPPPSR